MQVDDLGKEYYACFVKTGITIDDKMMRKLYFELKYRPHAFSDVEKSFFTRFSVNSTDFVREIPLVFSQGDESNKNQKNNQIITE